MTPDTDDLTVHEQVLFEVKKVSWARTGPSSA